jgi:hyaluronan synthase
VLAVMVVASVLSMAIRQVRHLAEKPSDFIRMPFFIVFSTLFLMPIRLLGFFRMAHVAGWGTRKGAYRAADLPAIAPPDAQRALTAGAQSGEAPHPSGVITTLKPSSTALALSAKPTPRVNPLATVPYLLGAAVFATEVMIFVWN